MKSIKVFDIEFVTRQHRMTWSDIIEYEYKSGTLSQCPRCYVYPVLVESPSDPEEGPGMGYYWYHIECPRCHISSKAEAIHPEKAIKNWF